MKLNELKSAKGARKRHKRIGRGPGSGHGKTATRGHKGQKARSGFSKKPGFEGGQMPLQRRVIKRGFKNLFKKEYEIVNLDVINKYFGEGESVTPETLRGKGLIKRSAINLKILSRGGLHKSVLVRANKFSKTAIIKIQQAGGTAEVI